MQLYLLTFRLNVLNTGACGKSVHERCCKVHEHCDVARAQTLASIHIQSHQDVIGRIRLHARLDDLK
jgi:hypothetical protein